MLAWSQLPQPRLGHTPQQGDGGGQARGDPSWLGGCWDTRRGNRLRSSPTPVDKTSWPGRGQSPPTPSHVFLLDRWCLSNCRMEGTSHQSRALGYVLYLGNEACCTLGWLSPPHQQPSPPQSKHRSLETREERGPNDPCTQSAVDRGAESQTATHPLPTRSRMEGPLERAGLAFCKAKPWGLPV